MQIKIFELKSLFIWFKNIKLAQYYEINADKLKITVKEDIISKKNWNNCWNKKYEAFIICQRSVSESYANIWIYCNKNKKINK